MAVREAQRLAPSDLVNLEGLIDRYGLYSVLQAAALIAHEKAEHVATNWQDPVLAKSWERDAGKLEKVALER